MDAPNITIRAYAKLNFGLHILGKRPDSFHDLHTHLHTIDFFDELSFELTDGDVDIHVEPIIEGVRLEDNLVYRAIKLFQAKMGIEQNVRCNLTKKIPAGAGLGGGSSDAAATLKALDQMFDTQLDQATLAEWGAELGSDVPFFIYGGFACAKGRGERITSMPSPYADHHFFVIVPPVQASTPVVFQAWSHEHPYEYPDTHCDHVQLHNDLQDVAVHCYPELLPYAELIHDAPTDFKGMSGSGSAFYAGFANEADALQFKSQTEQSLPDALTLCVRPIV